MPSTNKAAQNAARKASQNAIRNAVQNVRAAQQAALNQINRSRAAALEETNKLAALLGISRGGKKSNTRRNHSSKRKTRKN